MANDLIPRKGTDVDKTKSSSVDKKKNTDLSVKDNKEKGITPFLNTIGYSQNPFSNSSPEKKSPEGLKKKSMLGIAAVAFGLVAAALFSNMEEKPEEKITTPIIDLDKEPNSCVYSSVLRITDQNRNRGDLIREFSAGDRIYVSKPLKDGYTAIQIKSGGETLSGYVDGRGILPLNDRLCNTGQRAHP